VKNFIIFLLALYIVFLLFVMADMSEKYSTQIHVLKEACGITGLNSDVIPNGKCKPERDLVKG